MNFLTLKYFKVVAEELNITHASQKLYITQQALSSHIRNLENELGVSLFSRTPRLSLTDAGKYLYQATKDIEEINAVLNDRLNDIRKETRGELRIGISFTRGQFILPDVLPLYSPNHPNVHIKIFEEASDSLLDKLLKGEIDFWFTADEPPVEGLLRNAIFTEKFFLVAPKQVILDTYGTEKGNRKIEKIKKEFNFEDIIECPFVLLNPRNRSRDLFDNAMRNLHLVPQIMLETDNSQTAFALAQKEMALTVYSDMFLRNYSGKLNPEVLLISLEKFLPTDILHIYYTESIKMSAYKKTFLQTVHTVFDSE